MAKAKSIYLVALALGMLLAPADAEARQASTQYVQDMQGATCADFLFVMKTADRIAGDGYNHRLRGWVEWRYPGFADVEFIVSMVASDCTDPARASVTLEQDAAEVYHMAMTLAPKPAAMTPTTAEAKQIIEQMAMDPHYPMFQMLRNDMAKLLESGATSSLDDAYRIAKAAKVQSLTQVFSRPGATVSQRWVAAHELLYNIH